MTKIKGAPDLITEMLSAGNKKQDTETKKTPYEEFGVKKYFTIDPDNKDTITYYLPDKKFIKPDAAIEKIKSKLLKKCLFSEPLQYHL